MRLSIIKYILAAFVFLNWGCKKENMCDCVKTTGKIVTETRDIKNFSCIHLEDKIDLYLSNGPYHVEVQAGEHLQGLIKTELDGETLRVVNKNRCNWVRGYKHVINVYVSSPYFRNIEHDGSGTIYSKSTIVQDTIHCRVSNSGDIHLDVNCAAIYTGTHGNGDVYYSGITDMLQHDFSGTNFLYAKDLTIQHYAYVHSTSVGMGYIKSPEGGTMDVRLEDTGNLYYSGNPSTIHLTRGGKGDLIKD